MNNSQKKSKRFDPGDPSGKRKPPGFKVGCIMIGAYFIGTTFRNEMKMNQEEGEDGLWATLRYGTALTGLCAVFAINVFGIVPGAYVALFVMTTPAAAILALSGWMFGLWSLA